MCQAHGKQSNTSPFYISETEVKPVFSFQQESWLSAQLPCPSVSLLPPVLGLFCTILDLPIPFKSCSGQPTSFIDISYEMSLEFLCSFPLNPAAFETSFLGLIVFSLTFGPLLKTNFSAYYLIIHSLIDTFGELCIESLLCAR